MTRARPNRLKAEKGWVFKLDGAKWRRVVPSPLPKRIFEIRPVKWLLEKNTVVICAGGGGIPTMYDPDKQRWLTGIEAVIDKDLASELLAREVEADLLVIATDVNGVYLDWGKPEQRKLGWVTPEELRAHPFPAGSMGPKVAAAVQFVEKTGKRAAIGSLADIEQDRRRRRLARMSIWSRGSSAKQMVSPYHDPAPTHHRGCVLPQPPCLSVRRRRPSIPTSTTRCLHTTMFEPGQCTAVLNAPAPAYTSNTLGGQSSGEIPAGQYEVGVAADYGGSLWYGLNDVGATNWINSTSVSSLAGACANAKTQ